MNLFIYFFHVRLRVCLYAFVSLSLCWCACVCACVRVCLCESTLACVLLLVYISFKVLGAYQETRLSRHGHLNAAQVAVPYLLDDMPAKRKRVNFTYMLHTKTTDTCSNVYEHAYTRICV